MTSSKRSSAHSSAIVRFIYVERPDWYVTVTPRRDVFEMPINDALDISGWELRKALNLMRKSNPPLLKWLGLTSFVLSCKCVSLIR